jgi:hypothetical protein
MLTYKVFEMDNNIKLTDMKIIMTNTKINLNDHFRHKPGTAFLLQKVSHFLIQNQPMQVQNKE